MSISQKIEQWKGISFLDTIFKLITFKDIDMAISANAEKRHINEIRIKQQEKLINCRKKSSINVMFFLQTEAVWKYDSLYWMLEKSKQFKPIVVISPFNVHLIYDKNECLSVMKRAISFAESKGYNYVSAFDFEKKVWIDVKKEFHPDVVFFSKPYKDTLPAYHIYYFKETLTLYTPYGFSTGGRFRDNFNLPFHNLLWKFLLENNIYKQYAQQYSLSKGENVIVAGSFGTEKLIDPQYHPNNVWKPQDKKGKKRIIWAPHHTLDYLFNSSTFLYYYETILELADKYKDYVQFSFKPHPVLKFRLINLWGKEKTEAYYKMWESLDNTQLDEGYYMDLFLTSDAMIHDCISFTIEYLYTKKPVMLLVRNPEGQEDLNLLGQKCKDAHYHGLSKEDIESFILDVVINNSDPKLQNRENVFNDFLYPKDGVLPSQKTFDLLCKSLNKE